MLQQRNELNFKGQNIFIGIDTHLKSWKVSLIQGDILLKSFVQEADPEKLLRYLNQNYPNANYYSAYEASYCGYWIHKQLISYGIRNIIVNPSDVPTTDKEKKQKEDKRDSRKIARSLSKGELNGIYIPSQEILEDRSLLRLREKLTGDLVRYKNRIRFMLYFYGIQIPKEFEKSSHWSKRFITWIEEIKLKQDSGNTAKDTLLNHVKSYRESILSITQQIKKISQTEKYKTDVELLRSIPGIGLLTAMTIITEIDNIERFRDLDNFCSYVGIIPSTGSSGEREVTRGITPRKNHCLRRIIIESSWTAIRSDPALSQAYGKYIKTMNSNKAIVKISRKLLNRIRFVLINKRKYVPCVVK